MLPVGGAHPMARVPARPSFTFTGGWFNWGSAQAFQKLVGHIAKSAGAAAFVLDYRLAPEHPFPAAAEDVQACYQGLVERGFRVAVTGDSAGGNLALQLLATATGNGTVAPVAAVVLSPVTDLTLGGASWRTRAATDPFFVRKQAQGLVDAYLKGQDPAYPRRQRRGTAGFAALRGAGLEGGSGCTGRRVGGHGAWLPLWCWQDGRSHRGSSSDWCFLGTTALRTSLANR